CQQVRRAGVPLGEGVAAVEVDVAVGGVDVDRTRPAVRGVDHPEVGAGRVDLVQRAVELDPVDRAVGVHRDVADAEADGDLGDEGTRGVEAVDRLLAELGDVDVPVRGVDG